GRTNVGGPARRPGTALRPVPERPVVGAGGGCVVARRGDAQVAGATTFDARPVPGRGDRRLRRRARRSASDECSAFAVGGQGAGDFASFGHRTETEGLRRGGARRGRR